jgi:hypothetical protein
LYTNVLNHSRKSRAFAATSSSSAGVASPRTRRITSAGTNSACSSQLSKPSPSAIQSIGSSTGVATEFRKSSPGASARKIAGISRLFIFQVRRDVTMDSS